jgi:hypothetical protein
MSMQVGELALNELKVQCEDCCSQIFIFKPNKFVIYTAELCEEKDFENVSIPHLSFQNKTARIQQKKESKLIKTKQSFNKSPDFSESNGALLSIVIYRNYFIQS